MFTIVKQSDVLRCWNDRREGDDMAFYDFADHELLLEVMGKYRVISVYASPKGRIIATSGGWSQDVTDML